MDNIKEKIDKLKTKLSIIGMQDVFDIDDYGVVRSINNIHFGERINIPSECTGIFIDVLSIDNVLKENKCTLVIPKGVDRLVIPEENKVFKTLNKLLDCYKIECYSKDMLKDIIKYCDKTYKILSCNMHTSEEIKIAFNINEDEWLKLAMQFLNVSIPKKCKLDSEVIISIIVKESEQLFKKNSLKDMDRKKDKVKEVHTDFFGEILTDIEAERIVYSNMCIELEHALQSIESIKTSMKNNSIKSENNYEKLNKLKLAIAKRQTEISNVRNNL